MSDALWAGIHQKHETAAQHFIKMGQALLPPTERWGAGAAAAGTIMDTGWRQSFHTAYDAFLSAARSIPWIIEACFGEDTRIKVMKDWWKNDLTDEERTLRQHFHDQFAPLRAAFEALPLTTARDISAHRTGVAPVNMKNPDKTDSPAVRLPLPGASNENAGREYRPPLPKWSDLTVGEKPVYDECLAYLNAASKLIADARAIATTVHGATKLTAPPT